MKNLPGYKKCIICGKENPIGLNLTFKTDENKVFVSFALNKNYIGFENRIHGGVVAAVLDEAMGWACSVKTKNLYYTIELNIRYKKPVKPNITLNVEAQMFQTKHSVAYAKGVLKDENGNILVLSSGNYYPLCEDSEKETMKLLHHKPEDEIEVTKNDF